MVAMNLDPVVFDEPVQAGEFVFDPGARPVVDYTEVYLNQLDSSKPR
jgi:hypothetical protein